MDTDELVVTVLGAATVGQGELATDMRGARPRDPAPLTRTSPTPACSPACRYSDAAVLGRLTVSARSALWVPGQPLPAPIACPLDAKTSGAASPGEILVRTVLVAAPEASTPLRVLAATWNVGNSPPCDNLRPWLRNANDAAELVFIGSQECAYAARPPAVSGRGSSSASIVAAVNAMSSRIQRGSCEADWVEALQGALGPAYSLVRSDSLGQMKLCVFARFDCRAGITSSDVGTEATGLGHMHSNKGGVASCLEVWDTRLCCVNSHLAAHQGAVKRRNGDYSEIVSGIQLGQLGQDMMNQWDHLLWLGDLNYRLDLSDLFGEEAALAKTPPAELFNTITQLTEARDFGALVACDQLARAQARGDAFVGFQEGVLSHPPTFKVKRTTGLQYNTQRSPAYCDRILWRCLPGAQASQEALWAALECDSSDHKPVAASMLLSRQPVRPSWAPRRGVGLPLPRRSLRDALGKRQGAVPPLQTWKLQLLTMFGHDLMAADFNGLSDPYVAFMGDCMPRMAVTDVVFATLDPCWSLDKLPTLVLAGPSLEALRTERILIQAVDYDATSMDDPIGCGVLPLGPLLEQAGRSSDGTAEFEVPLTWAGLSQGNLTGRVRLSPGEAMPLPAFLAAKRKQQYVAPKKKFTFARAMGLVKDAPPALHNHTGQPGGQLAVQENSGAGCGCFTPPSQGKPAAKGSQRQSQMDDDNEDLDD